MRTEGSVPGRLRPTWIILFAVAFTAVAALAVWALGADGADDDSRAAVAGTSAPTSSSPAPGSATTAPTSPAVSPSPDPGSDVAGVPASLAAVGLDDAVDAGGGLTAELTSIAAIQGAGAGPGNIAGPALAVTVRITNGTGAPLLLDQVEVALSYTAEEVAASPVDDDAVSPLRGTLSDAASAQGTYVFSVPADQREVVSVTVGLVAGSPLLVFTGAAV